MPTTKKLSLQQVLKNLHDMNLAANGAKMPPTYTCPRCKRSLHSTAHICPALGPDVTVDAGLSFAPRSQKAKGVFALANAGDWSVPSPLVVNHPQDVAPGHWSRALGRLPAWTRPCPTRPRHGFVDSRLVSTPEELTALWDETRAADPLGELLLMPMVDASASAILCPGLLVVGPGNDGATAGYGSISIPLRDDVKISRSLLVAAEIRETSYLEVVMDNGNVPHAVQLRDGPSVPRTRDFQPLPNGFKVANVVAVAEDPADRPDLLTWERMVKEFPSDTAVWHPGGSMASHIAVHCKDMWHRDQTCIPVLTTKEPAVGDTLPHVKENSHWHPELVLRGLAVGLSATLDYKSACRMTLLALHNSSALSLAPIGSFILGAGIAYAVRLGLCAAHGEARHAACRRPDVQGIMKGKRGKPLSRSQIYDLAWTESTKAKRSLPQLVALYDDRQLWGAGFGGQAWANCTRATVTLINRTITFARTPNATTLADAKIAYNIMVNQAHNGGWWFDKFTSPSDMNLAANGDFHFLFECIPAVWSTLQADIPEKCPFASWYKLKETEAPPMPPPPGTSPTIPHHVKVIAKGKPVTLVSAQAVPLLDHKNVVHLQWKLSIHTEDQYLSHNVIVPPEVFAYIQSHTSNMHESYAKSGKFYCPLKVDVLGTKACCGDALLQNLLELATLADDQSHDDVDPGPDDEEEPE